MDNPDRAGAQMARVVRLMARLRGPDGCPWDREQSLASLRRWLLEESYEVLEAIDQGDLDHLREELGDLLLQIVFQSQIASEQGAFDVGDVAAGLADKLVERHPHVFGDAQDRPSTPAEVSERWERRKAAKHRARGSRKSALAGVPEQLPALLRAQRIQEKAARVGFEWHALEQVWAKVREEMQELREAAELGAAAAIAEEYGDLLFALVNLGRFLKLVPEDSLRAATTKFTRRFACMEEQGPIEGRSLDELLDRWLAAKAQAAGNPKDRTLVIGGESGDTPQEVL